MTASYRWSSMSYIKCYLTQDRGRSLYSNFLMLWAIRKCYQLKNMGLYSGPRPTVDEPSYVSIFFLLQNRILGPFRSTVLPWAGVSKEWLEGGDIHAHRETETLLGVRKSHSRLGGGACLKLMAEWIVKSRCLSKLVIFTKLKCHSSYNLIDSIFHKKCDIY